MYKICGGRCIEIEEIRDRIRGLEKEFSGTELPPDEGEEESKLDRFERFNQEFFASVPESKDFKWLNRAILYRLSESIVVQITLYAGEKVNQDFGYDVEIINKRTGKITDKRFPFAMYLRDASLSKIEVSDGSWIRSDPGEKSVEELAHKIMGYIELWK